MQVKTLCLLIMAIALMGCSGKPTPEPQRDGLQDTMQQQRDRAFEELDRRTGQ